MNITLGQIAGIIAALAFVYLVIMISVPLLKLGKLIDETTETVKESTEHTLPILDEAASTVAQANQQLGHVDKVTSSAADISQNVSALTALVSATLGKPLIKIASFNYAAKRFFRGEYKKK